MDDNYQDYSTEGTAPVVVPGSGSVPEPVVVPDNPILLPAPGPGPSKSPMSKRMKFMLGLFSAVILVSGLVTSLMLVKQKQNTRIRAMPNVCTWETCGDIKTPEGEAKWNAGAYDQTRLEHIGENPGADAAFLERINVALDNQSQNQETTNVANDLKTNLSNFTKTASSTDVSELNKLLTSTVTLKDGTTVSLSNDEKQLLKQVTIAPNTQTTDSNATITNITGGLPLKDTVMGQSIDNACNYDLICKKYTDWQNGWDLARHDQKYLNQNLIPKQTEYTDVAKDLDPSTPLHQVGTIEKDSSGKLVITQVFSVTSNSGNCADTNELCWVTELNKNGYSFTIAPVGKMVDGKIVYNQTVSGSSVIGTDALNKKFKDNGCVQPAANITGNSTEACICGGKQNGYYCADWGGKDFCTGDAEVALGKTKGSLTCGNALYQASGYDIHGGYGGYGGSATPAKFENGLLVYTITTTTGTFTVKFDPKTKKIFSVTGTLPNNSVIKLFQCQNIESNWGKDCRETLVKEFTIETLKTLTLGACNSIQQLDIDTGLATGHISIDIRSDSSLCGTTTTTTFTPTGGPPAGGGGNPPTTTTFSGSTPTPTPSTNPQLACYQLQIFRGGTQIQPWQINQGDALVFRGFASVNGGAVVSKMRFVVTVNSVAQAPVDVNASLVGGLYQADLPYTITQNTSYSVSTTPI